MGRILYESILTSAGSEVITGNEINDKVVDLEQKLEANNLAIIDKDLHLQNFKLKLILYQTK